MDKRRRQYAALDVWFLASNTVQDIAERFGSDGVVCWLAMIAAAKRSPVQGSLQFANEATFRETIMWPDTLELPPLDEFLAFLSKRKQIARTRKKTGKTGTRRVLETYTLTNFQQWQRVPTTFADRQRKAAWRQAFSNTNRSDERPDNRLDERSDDPSDKGVQRRDETIRKYRRNSKSVAEEHGDDSAEGYAAASAWIEETGWQLAPGHITTHILTTWPELDDTTVAQLIKDANRARLEHTTPAA